MAYATRKDMQTLLRLLRGVIEGDIGRHHAAVIVNRLEHAWATEDYFDANQHDGFFEEISEADDVQKKLDFEAADIADILENAAAKDETNVL